MTGTVISVEFVWTEERVGELKRLWAAGDTASEIARKLGTSKNAIVGKARRLNLAMRQRSAKMIAAQARAIRTELQVPAGCTWIDGDPRADDSWRYCQAETLPGSSYCAEHHAVCHPRKKAS